MDDTADYVSMAFRLSAFNSVRGISQKWVLPQPIGIQDFAKETASSSHSPGCEVYKAGLVLK
jgi:hypothetical protein